MFTVMGDDRLSEWGEKCTRGCTVIIVSLSGGATVENGNETREEKTNTPYISEFTAKTYTFLSPACLIQTPRKLPERL